jgi:tetratricopeptide (TPR) repeat protein
MNVRQGIWLAAVVLGCQAGWVIGGGAEADRAELMFREANRFYEQGDYAAAAAAYEDLLAQNAGSAALHFNLGNAHFKSEQLGRAIWQYRMARDLSPRDADIRANLQFARSAVGQSHREGRWWRWVGWLTLNEWSVWSGVLFWLSLGLVTAVELIPAMGRRIRFGVRLLWLCWLASALGLGLALHQQFGRLTAIAVGSGEVRYGPFEESQVHFAIRDGAELSVRDSREGWLQVEDARGGTGWIEQSRVIVHPGGF